MALSEVPPQVEPPPRATPKCAGRPSESAPSLYALSTGLVAAATSWFLLKELGPLLRPLILAVFLAYLIVPIHQWFRRRISPTASAAVIVGGTLLLVWGLAM